jgi:hypothetical protein
MASPFRQCGDWPTFTPPRSTRPLVGAKSPSVGFWTVGHPARLSSSQQRTNHRNLQEAFASPDPATIKTLSTAENGRKHFHNRRPVTSNLAPHPQLAHHGQGGGGISSETNGAHNSCALKILTSNLFAIKILQTLFANPAPSKTFRGMGGGGLPQE